MHFSANRHSTVPWYDSHVTLADGILYGVVRPISRSHLSCTKELVNPVPAPAKEGGVSSGPEKCPDLCHTQHLPLKLVSPSTPLLAKPILCVQQMTLFLSSTNRKKAFPRLRTFSWDLEGFGRTVRARIW